MTSTPTQRLRLDKQAPGDNPNAWGERLNAALDMIDETAGFAEITVNGNVVLSSVNFASDQARRFVLRLIGSGGFSVTVPSVEKAYYIDNRCAADVVLKTASTSGAAVIRGTKRIAYCDGATITTDTSAGAPSASDVAFDPSGDVVSFNVQDAIEELDLEKFPRSGGLLNGTVHSLVNGDAFLAAEDTSAPSSSFRRKQIFSTKFLDSANTWLFRATRPSDGAVIDTTLKAAGEIWAGASASSSLSFIGYQKLPSGLIVQWGSTVIPNTGTSINFPIVFPIDLFTVIPANGDSGSGQDLIYSVGIKNNSGFFINTSPYRDISLRVNWVAFGR